MTHRHLLRAVLGVAVLALLWAGWVSWQAWCLRGDLVAAAADARTVRSAILAGDREAARPAMGDLSAHSAAAADRTDSWSWSLLTRVPGVGDDARGLRTTSSVLADLSTTGLRPLVDAADELTRLQGPTGRVSVPALRRLGDPLATAAAALESASEQLATEDPFGFAAPVAGPYEQLADQVEAAGGTLRAAASAVEVLPAMLGGQGRRTYLLAVQNNAEIRATGGLPSALTLVSADEGRLAIEGQATAQDLGERAAPLPITAEERAVFGPELGTFVVDATFTPDFPRAAELLRARWEEVRGGRVDGVVAVDPVALSYLLPALGGVTVDGVELRADNAVEELLSGVYRRYERPADQDAFFQAAARSVFDALVSRPAPPRSLLEGLGRAGDEGRLLVHSFGPEQESLSGTRVAGELASVATPGPQVSVSLNDTTGAKMSYYLRHSVTTTSTSCRDAVQDLTVTADLRSTAPRDAATSLPAYVTGDGRYGVDPGRQLVTVRLVAPVGGGVLSYDVDGEPASVDDDTLLGRPVETAYVLLEPGERSRITWRVRSGPDQSDQVRTVVTPGLLPGDASSVSPSSC